MARAGAALVLLGFAVWFSWDIVAGHRFLSQPDLANYYFPYRQWLVHEISQGRFPLWNPFWGLGQATEWFLAIPVDLYTPFELLLGPRYGAFYLVQLGALLGAACYAFRKVGCRPLEAAAASLLFFLMPNVTHWYFYFLLVPSYIANLLCFVFLRAYLGSGASRHLFHAFWTIALSMLGTKAEFWFQNAVLYVFYVLALAAIESRRRRLDRRLLLTRCALSLAPLALAVLSQAWQLNMTWRLLALSGRTSPRVAPHEIALVALQSLTGSALVVALLGTLALVAIAGGGRALRLGAGAGWVAWLALGYWSGAGGDGGSLAVLWRQRELLTAFATGPVLLGAALAAALALVLEREFRWRREVRSLAWFLPFVYYWCRTGAGDSYGEMAVIRTAPAGSQAVLAALVWLGVRRVGRSGWATLAWVSALFVLVMREQGQVLLSHLTGMVWVPQRDSYLVDFAWVVLAAVGLHRAERLLRLALRRRSGGRRWAPLALAAAPLSVVVVVIAVNGLRPDPYHAHWMMDRAPPDYPYYTGVPAIRQALRELKREGAGRILIVNKPTKSQTFGYGESLLEGLGQVTLYSSAVPRNYRDWAFYQRVGRRPGDWIGYNSAFPPQMLARLPRRDDAGMPNDLLYFHTIIARPGLEPSILRLMGVTHVLWFRRSLEDPTVAFFDLGDRESLTRRLEALQLQDVREVPAGYYVPNSNPDQTFLAESLVVGRLPGALPRAFVLREVPPAGLSELMQELDPVPLAGAIRTRSFELPTAPATIERDEAEVVRVRARGGADAYLVLADLHHPFWTATLDGQPVESVPAFSVFRAARVPAGEHVVEWRYELPSFYPSLALSVVTVTAVGGVQLLARRRSAGSAARGRRA